MSKNIYKNVILTKVSTGFHHLIEPDNYKGKIRWDMEMIFDPKDPNLAKLVATVNEVTTEAFGPKAISLIATGTIKSPIKTNKYEKSVALFVAEDKGTQKEAEEKYAAYKGKVVVTARSKDAPQLFYPKGQVGQQLAPFGQVVTTGVSVGSYNVESKGVAVYLNAVNIVSIPENANRIDYAAALGVLSEETEEAKDQENF
jgi:Protein of unknown function (DUF2815)